MDPQTNIVPGSVNPEATGATDTFSEQVAAEKSVSEENFNQSQLATSQHNRRILYYVIWAVLLLLLLSAVAGGSYILWRNRQGLAENLGIGNLFNPTRIDIKSPQATIDVGGGDGLLTVNGSQLITGDLTVNGDANIGGNLTAASFIGDGSQLTGVSADLPPFVAFTNRNNQLFFGNNQLFRNNSDSTTALTVQQSNGNQVFGVDTLNNKAKVNNGLEVGNIANLQGSIFNDPFFGIGGNIYKNLAVASEITNNQPGVTYTASGSEFLINPQNDPYTGGNLFAASYSGAKIAPGNPYNYITVAGSLSSLVHAGNGLVEQAVGQVNIVGNEGPGVIAVAANSSYSTTLSYAGTGLEGSILTSTGVLALNPSILPTATGTILVNSGITAGNCQAFIDAKAFLGIPGGCVGTQYSPNVLQNVGLSVLNQDASSSLNVNIYSEGPASTNYLEGTTAFGICSPVLLSAIPETVPGPTCSGYTGKTVTSGPKMLVGGPSVVDTSSIAQITTGWIDTTAMVPTWNDGKGLVVQAGGAAQTSNLTEWQDSTGSALSVVAADGSVGIGTSTPANKLDVTDTSDDTPANFTGASGTCTVDTLGGGWSCVSDEKLKENILQINSASDIIDQLRGVTFAWKSDEEKSQVSGFIAQEVQKVLPGLVNELEDGTLSLNKDGMIPYLVEAVKENNGKISSINTQLAEQGIKLDSLSEEFTKLAERITGVENKVEILETKVINQEQRIRDLESKINTNTTSSP